MSKQARAHREKHLIHSQPNPTTLARPKRDQQEVEYANTHRQRQEQAIQSARIERQLRKELNYNTALDIVQETAIYALAMGAETLLMHFCEWLLSDLVENTIFAIFFHGVGYSVGFATVLGLLFYIVSSIIKRNQLLKDIGGDEQED